MTDKDVERVARADHSRAVYARALAKMRDMLTVVHDGLEDEGDRVYLGSTNHAELIHEAWHLADALKWDEIMADTQPDHPLAETNLRLQAELAEARAMIAAHESAVTDIAKLGTVSLTSFDGHCVRIDFPNREDAERMYAVLTAEGSR
jgi:hypothetical protein